MDLHLVATGTVCVLVTRLITILIYRLYHKVFCVIIIVKDVITKSTDKNVSAQSGNVLAFRNSNYWFHTVTFM
jgi:hypothetical protein